MKTLQIGPQSKYPNLVCTQIETISDTNYLVLIPFER